MTSTQPTSSTHQTAPRAGPSSTFTQTQHAVPSILLTQQPVLRLRGARTETVEEEGEEEGESVKRRIQWAEDVVDNEGLGRKKSKVCCIYHAPKGIDESSDESSSSSDDSDSDSGNDDGAARPSRAGKGKDCGHDHRDGQGHSHGNGKGKSKPRKRSPNAYEKMPKPKPGGGSGGLKN